MSQITFNISSIPQRKNELIKTIDSIINQVDLVRVSLNGHTHKEADYIIDAFEGLNVYFMRTDNTHGDSYKFYWVKESEGYYMTGDDDIQYPPTYIDDTIKQIDKYKVVSYHGRTFLKFPIESYYRTPAIRNHCLSQHDTTEPVHIPGTGVLAFNTKYFNPPFSIFKRRNMSDVWIGCYAKEQGIDIWGLKHSADYFTYQKVKNTIWENKVDNCEFETKTVNECFMKN